MAEKRGVAEVKSVWSTEATGRLFGVESSLYPMSRLFDKQHMSLIVEFFAARSIQYGGIEADDLHYHSAVDFR